RFAAFHRRWMHRFHEALQLGNGRCEFWIGRQIADFLRVISVVVELRAFLTTGPFRVPPALGAHAMSRHSPPLHLRVGGAFPCRSRIVQERTQAGSLELLRSRYSRQ